MANPNDVNTEFIQNLAEEIRKHFNISNEVPTKPIIPLTRAQYLMRKNNCKNVTPTNKKVRKMKCKTRNLKKKCIQKQRNKWTHPKTANKRIARKKCENYKRFRIYYPTKEAIYAKEQCINRKKNLPTIYESIIKKSWRKNKLFKRKKHAQCKYDEALLDNLSLSSSYSIFQNMKANDTCHCAERKFAENVHEQFVNTEYNSHPQRRILFRIPNLTDNTDVSDFASEHCKRTQVSYKQYLAKMRKDKRKKQMFDRKYRLWIP